jgi:Glycosyl-hydrolase 97 C-terminal, oligomerisation
MDYTPVTYSDTRNQTNNAHQTALDIVFESSVQHLADKPATYDANVAKDLLKIVPVASDETKLIEGDPGRFATLARRSGKDWYVGAIADAARTAEIPLSFLGPGNFMADIFQRRLGHRAGARAAGRHVGDGAQDSATHARRARDTNHAKLTSDHRLGGTARRRLRRLPLRPEGELRVSRLPFDLAGFHGILAPLPRC